MFRDLKYIFAYVAPLSCLLALEKQGLWSFSTVVVTFVLIPLVEQFAKGITHNLSEKEEEAKAASPLFDWMLYLNVPLLMFLLWRYFSVVSTDIPETYEMTGLTLSMGITLGALGINVAHELGHRQKRFEQILAKMLLTTALYTQFNIEHNRGHHKWVATDEDPSSARLGESLYLFWVRSMRQTYLKAWKLENERLHQLGIPAFSWKNEMIWFQIAHLGYLAAVWFFFGWTGVGFAVAVALIAVSLLETVNYIEHYGLRRQRLPSGRYEQVSPRHSWNSNHEIGRIFLYELTRHSDHHFKSTRKYQVLRHFDESPQLPFGYPASMLLAMAPPLWFRAMDKRVKGVPVLRPLGRSGDSDLKVGVPGTLLNFLFPIIVGATCCLLFSACGDDFLFEKKAEVSGQSWSYEDSLRFDFTVEDTTKIYSLLLDVEHAADYGFQNLYVQMHTRYPSGKMGKQLLSLELAAKSGTWNGECGGQWCEVEIPLLPGASFPELGQYSLTVEQFMRQSPLPGVRSMVLKMKQVGIK